MEKKTITSISLLVIISFVAGLLLGGIAMRPAPTTTTVTQVSTVAATTVEIPIRYQLGASYAIAHTTCILYGSPQQGEHDPEKCEGGGHTKAVEINIVLRGLGTENVYIIPLNLRVITPGLPQEGHVTGRPRDATGRITVPSTGSANIRVLVEVADQASFYKWIADGGKIAVTIPFHSQDGNYAGKLTVDDIELLQVGWKVPTNSTEAGPRG
jgi:hypothetical protein